MGLKSLDFGPISVMRILRQIPRKILTFVLPIAAEVHI